MRILVTGACGYKGSVLVPKLLAQGHTVTALDIMWFGNNLTAHENLVVKEHDIRDVASLDLTDFEAIIHLASVANDPCGDLNPKLTWEISCLATMQLADKASKSGIKQFIYASSGSVYGIKDEEQVTEELELTPISEYNKTKMVAERVLLSYADKMAVQIVRPATVCGLSPRMRLDVSVNLLTMAALKNNNITVFGGDQARPNIHMDDITDLYIFMLNNPDKTQGVFNAGFENITIMDIAKLVQANMSDKGIECSIEVTPSNDPRSYRVNSDKLLATGFKPSKTVADAIEEIVDAYQSGELTDKPEFHNLHWMQDNIINKK
ncbi:NAD-dependent epimerase/dehydratase [Colwellia sp. 39_35_sub15_T18]|nr:NAD-dependent epimerase/dehydratase [Colwellia sp. 39_35_sub15_T18]